MSKRDFIKEAGRFYLDMGKTLVRSLIPKTEYVTEVDLDRYREYLFIGTHWMGQTLKQEKYELADRPERMERVKERLNLMKEGGLITEEEYKKSLREAMKAPEEKRSHGKEHG